MEEVVGKCQTCNKTVYCLDGFLDGVHINQTLYCFECADKEKNSNRGE